MAVVIPRQSGSRVSVPDAAMAHVGPRNRQSLSARASQVDRRGLHQRPFPLGFVALSLLAIMKLSHPGAETLNPVIPEHAGELTPSSMAGKAPVGRD